MTSRIQRSMLGENAIQAILFHFVTNHLETKLQNMSNASVELLLALGARSFEMKLGFSFDEQRLHLILK